MIVRCDFHALKEDPDFQVLHDAYAAESAITGMPTPKADLAAYESYESLGFMTTFCAYTDNRLVGVLIMLLADLPHYGKRVATTESFFVLKEFRSTGAGLRLLREAERYAKQNGAVGFLVSAPEGGKLAKVMSASSEYKPSNRVFFKDLA